jgi:hypothetical protein
MYPGLSGYRIMKMGILRLKMVGKIISRGCVLDAIKRKAESH